MSGSGVFEVKLTSFENDHGLLATGLCCSGVAPPGEGVAGGRANPCVAPCRTFVRLCFSHYMGKIPANPPCTYGEETSGVLGSNSLPPSVADSPRPLTSRSNHSADGVVPRGADVVPGDGGKKNEDEDGDQLLFKFNFTFSWPVGRS